MDVEDTLYRCTVCGREGTVGRCCGEETREPLNDTAKEEQRNLKEHNSYWVKKATEMEYFIINNLNTIRAEAYNNGRKDATLVAMQHGFYSADDISVIRAEARAEALREAADHAEKWYRAKEYSDELSALSESRIVLLRAAITQDEVN